MVACLTHLPRRVASGHGIVVIPEYIEECHWQRKRLPEEKFLLEPPCASYDSASDSEWDDEDACPDAKRPCIANPEDDDDEEITTVDLTGADSADAAQPPDAVDDGLNLLPALPTFLDKYILLLSDQLSAEMIRKFRRIAMTYDAYVLVATNEGWARTHFARKLVSSLEELEEHQDGSTRFIIVGEEESPAPSYRHASATVVSGKWLEDCERKSRLCDSTPYVIGA